MALWHFDPASLEVGRSIQFDEPHLSSKLSYRMARRFGRRLFRAYGWHGNAFVLAANGLKNGCDSDRSEP